MLGQTANNLVRQMFYGPSRPDRDVRVVQRLAVVCHCDWFLDSSSQKPCLLGSELVLVSPRRRIHDTTFYRIRHYSRLGRILSRERYVTKLTLMGRLAVLAALHAGRSRDSGPLA